MKDKDELVLDIVEKLARDGATGAKKRQVDTVKTGSHPLTKAASRT
jgi:hypothetical protein